MAIEEGHFAITSNQFGEYWYVPVVGVHHNGAQAQTTTQRKLSKYYFDEPLIKTVTNAECTRKSEQPIGICMVTRPHIGLKYIKNTSELQVITTYKFCCK